FKTIKEKLYDTTAYPSQEHLYYRNFAPALERLLFISKHLKKLDESNMQFCDLGFGPGVLTQFILQEKPKWHGWGIDISPECVHYANKLMKLKEIDARVQLTTGDVRQLAYGDETFDLILAMEVLEHIPDPLEGLQEAVRVLKPGGYAITSIPVQLPIPMHLYVPKSPREVLNLYEHSGLDVLDFSAKEFKIETGSFVATFAFSVKG
ncbi:class I SAM-dependent methyltransferase, partial [Candidatus Poribacteria bacterium]|nr:class I SAM-dependent methyltransferase [Candidatus Poribacteria bacterium]